MKKLISIVTFLFLAITAYSQSAEKITDILNSAEINYGQACYLSAIHQNLITEDSSYENAVQVLFDNKQLPELTPCYNPITAANLAFIYLNCWPNLKGSFMYRLTKGSPRYAYKQLKADGIFDDYTDPTTVFSGEEALMILTACMIEYGSEEECMEMQTE